MMVKEAKFFRKQAERAERMAVAASDSEASQSFSSLAQAYRIQADALKTSKKEQTKKKTPKGNKPKKKPTQRLGENKSKNKSRRK